MGGPPSDDEGFSPASVFRRALRSAFSLLCSFLACSLWRLENEVGDLPKPGLLSCTNLPLQDTAFRGAVANGRGIALPPAPLVGLAPDFQRFRRKNGDATPVSYTHLTLPTIYSV